MNLILKKMEEAKKKAANIPKEVSSSHNISKIK